MNEETIRAVTVVTTYYVPVGFILFIQPSFLPKHLQNVSIVIYMDTFLIK